MCELVLSDSVGSLPKDCFIVKYHAFEFEDGSQPVRHIFVFSYFALSTNFSTVKLFNKKELIRKMGTDFSARLVVTGQG